MKDLAHYAVTMLAAGSVFALTSATALGQDAAQADPKHYKVEFENEQVRVLRITYGPKEKSVMHEHPDSVAVFLTDGKIKFNLPDGNSKERNLKAGKAIWSPAQKHLPENLTDKPFEAILVEMKKR